MNSEVVVPPHSEKAVPHRTFRLPREIGILGALGLMLLVLAIFVPQFRDLQNITNITRNFSFVGIVAMGMTCVILTGGIDLHRRAVRLGRRRAEAFPAAREAAKTGDDDGGNNDDYDRNDDDDRHGSRAGDDTG